MEANELRNLLIQIAHSQQKASGKIQGLIDRDTQNLIEGTLGVDFLGEKYPITPQAYMAYRAIEEQFKELMSEFPKDDEGNQRLNKWLGQERADLFARSNTRDNVPVPLAQTLKEVTIESTKYQPVSKEEIEQKLKEIEKQR